MRRINPHIYIKNKESSMKKVISFIFVAVLIIACVNPNPTPQPMDDMKYCQLAENNLKALACIPKDKPFTLKGKSFAEFCIETMQNKINLHPKCLSEIKSCNQIGTCTQGK